MEHLFNKKMFSFGHCPNYLSPRPPIWATWSFFPDVKNDVLGVWRNRIVMVVEMIIVMIMMTQKHTNMNRNGPKIRAGAPPVFGHCPEDKLFFREVFRKSWDMFRNMNTLVQLIRWHRRQSQFEMVASWWEVGGASCDRKHNCDWLLARSPIILVTNKPPECSLLHTEMFL